MLLFPSSVIVVLLSLADGGVTPRPAAPAAAAPRAPSGAPRPAAPAAVKRAAPKVNKTAATATRGPARKRTPPRPKMIELFHVNSKESLKLRFVDDRGKPVRGLQKRANHFFRCHHTNKESRMNSRLLRLLFETGRHWPGQRLEVVSGYRHPTVAKNPRSPHMKGLACDFRVVGVSNTDLRDYLRRVFPHVGVGYYPNSSFVHLDVRQGASAFWIDYSGPGENAVYSDNASEDLRSGRADTFKPTRIDPAWAERDDLADMASGTAASAGGQPPAPPTAVGAVPAAVTAPQVQ